MSEPTHDKEPEGQPPAGKWEAIRYAVRGWGTTVRLCVVCVVIEAPMLLWSIMRR
jgi:hypothetical protein